MVSTFRMNYIELDSKFIVIIRSRSGCATKIVFSRALRWGPPCGIWVALFYMNDSAPVNLCRVRRASVPMGWGGVTRILYDLLSE